MNEWIYIYIEREREKMVDGITFFSPVNTIALPGWNFGRKCVIRFPKGFHPFIPVSFLNTK